MHEHGCATGDFRQNAATPPPDRPDPGKRAHSGAQLFRIDGELGQSGDSEQAGAVSPETTAPRQANRSRASGVSITSMFSMENGISARQFRSHFVAVEVLAVKNGEVLPVAAGFAAPLAEGGDVRTSEVSTLCGPK